MKQHIFNRCIFQIYLKYIKLVIQEILFILVLYNFNFYFKIIWPPPPPTKLSTQQYDPPSKVKFLDIPAKTFTKFLTPPQVGVGGWGGCMSCLCCGLCWKLCGKNQKNILWTWICWTWIEWSKQYCEKSISVLKCSTYLILPV